MLVEMADGTRVKVVTAAAEEFPEGVAVGIDFALPDLYLFQMESREAVSYGVT